jgi:hypothetical protein
VPGADHAQNQHSATVNRRIQDYVDGVLGTADEYRKIAKTLAAPGIFGTPRYTARADGLFVEAERAFESLKRLKAPEAIARRNLQFDLMDAWLDVAHAVNQLAGASDGGGGDTAAANALGLVGVSLGEVGRVMRDMAHALGVERLVDVRAG